MPQNISAIQIFVASPSDVQEERNALQSVVNEVNQNLAKGLGIILELVRWETHVTPGFGVDAQDVVNQDIGDNYDIFIGILWTRVGTPTTRAESGTLEEFDRAYKRYKENPNALDLLIYFKETPVSISELDIDQITKIKTFRNSLGEKGGLYWTFDSLSDFEATLRAHLSNLTRKWRERIDKSSSENITHLSSLATNVDAKELPESNALSSEIVEAINQIDSEEDIGFLDYIEIYNSKFAAMSEALDAINKATIAIGKKADRHLKAINLANQIKDQTKVISRVKKIFKLISDDFNTYATILDENVKPLSDSKSEAFDALGKALVMFAEYNPNGMEELENLENQLEQLLENEKLAFISMNDFKTVIANLPKFTTQFNKSKRLALIALDKFLVELTGIENTSQNLLNSISELKEGKNPPLIG